MTNEATQKFFNRVWNRYGVDRKPFGFNPATGLCTVGGGPDNLPPCALGLYALPEERTGYASIPESVRRRVQDQGVPDAVIESIRCAHDIGGAPKVRKQYGYDKLSPREAFRAAMRAVAQKYGLQCPEGRSRA